MHTVFIPLGATEHEQNRDKTMNPEKLAAELTLDEIRTLLGVDNR